ncbi:hypothetical protein [Candidatus Endomicrobiellum agilis]|nr:hypothetical protein [Endomicrobium sp.]
MSKAKRHTEKANDRIISTRENERADRIEAKADKVETEYFDKIGAIN